MGAYTGECLVQQCSSQIFTEKILATYMYVQSEIKFIEINSILAVTRS